MNKRRGNKTVPAAFFAVFLIFICARVPAQEGGIKSSTNVELQISTAPEAKLVLHQSFAFPFLRGNGPLTMDNNITADLSAELTPVSVNGIAEINWTPAAFFVVSGGGKAGSGWNMALGDGIGINKPATSTPPAPGAPAREAIIDGEAFDGLLWSAWGAGTLQFDLGALIPGDWTHVLFQTRQEFRYSAYTRAGTDDSWVFENDDGENKNGWTYNAMYVLGYHMPQSPVLDTIAFVAELKKPLYNTPGGDFWGENLGYWIFSGLFNFSFHPRFSTALAIQMHTRRNHGSSTFGDRSYYYRDFELENGDGQRRILFYRAAVILNYKIH